MLRSLFLRIVDAVKDHDYYFQQQSDGLGRMRLLPSQKVTVIFRMLAYGLPADATDEYVKISKSTAIESMPKFCHAMVEIFAERYLRTPNANDIARLLYIGKKRDFSGMLGSLDCTNNDINVLESSNLFSNLAQCIAPHAHYVIQGKEYNMSYYLDDDIYPKWATIVQTIQQPQGRKKKYFVMKQEACRKDIIKDKDAHIALRNALIDHLWEEYTNSNS
ncbi:uncharacterized protein LOC109821808 [Asparagus officinalis]|uniref:uncharacterized protein LOC109821808 n=1 Tax=Asparagus officinalis TaxID=4686 RepID=UPI00098E1EC0|nr:uncharacterized protein LOC109821808 [Asparagus officinalis]